MIDYSHQPLCKTPAVNNGTKSQIKASKLVTKCQHQDIDDPRYLSDKYLQK